MGLAANERALAVSGRGCLGKAADDEPVFILRAQDKLMPVALSVWIQEAAAYIGHDHPKVLEAKELLDKVHRWGATHPTKMPD
jgi:hypothetical protein